MTDRVLDLAAPDTDIGQHGIVEALHGAECTRLGPCSSNGPGECWEVRPGEG